VDVEQGQDGVDVCEVLEQSPTRRYRGVLNAQSPLRDTLSNGVPLKKPVSVQLVKILPTIYGTQRIITKPAIGVYSI
jgi:hypothetical protein